MATGTVLIVSHKTLRNDTRLVLIARAALQHAQRETVSLTVRAGTQPAPWPAVPVWAPFSTYLDQTEVAKLPEKMKQLVQLF